MTVIAAFKLEAQIPPRDPSRQSQCRHRGFGSAGGESGHLGTGDQVHDQLGQLDFSGSRCTKGSAILESLLDRLEDHRVSVPQNHRSPGSDEIDVQLSFGISDTTTAGTVDESGSSSYRPISSDGAVDPTRNHLAGPIKQILLGYLHRCGLLAGFECWWEGNRLRSHGPFSSFIRSAKIGCIASHPEENLYRCCC